MLPKGAELYLFADCVGTLEEHGRVTSCIPAMTQHLHAGQFSTMPRVKTLAALKMIYGMSVSTSGCRPQGFDNSLSVSIDSRTSRLLKSELSGRVWIRTSARENV